MPTMIHRPSRPRASGMIPETEVIVPIAERGGRGGSTTGGGVTVTTGTGIVGICSIGISRGGGVLRIGTVTARSRGFGGGVVPSARRSGSGVGGRVAGRGGG